MPQMSQKRLTKSSKTDLILYAITLFAFGYLTIRAFIPFTLEMLR